MSRFKAREMKFLRAIKVKKRRDTIRNTKTQADQRVI